MVFHEPCTNKSSEPSYLSIFFLPQNLTICEIGLKSVKLYFFTGRIPQPYLIAYSASKFALDGFFGGLREELTMKGSDVSVTICIIGFIGE